MCSRNSCGEGLGTTLYSSVAVVGDLGSQNFRQGIVFIFHGQLKEKSQFNIAAKFQMLQC